LSALLESFTYRGLLQPGEIIKYKISFLPKTCGNYKHHFEIGVIGWPVKFTITCVAACDIPRIDTDPYFLFRKVVEYRIEKTKYDHCVFVENTNTFEFGGILLPNTETNTSVSLPLRRNSSDLLLFSVLSRQYLVSSSTT
jgi:hypothetical protein